MEICTFCESDAKLKKFRNGYICPQCIEHIKQHTYTDKFDLK